MTRKIKKYGWIPDLPDQRDHRYAAPQPVLARLPKKVDLRRGCPPVFNQGELGSCTANAIAAAHQFDQMKQNKSGIFTPSRLFIYYNEREVEGTCICPAGKTLYQNGSNCIHNGFIAVKFQGALRDCVPCTERDKCLRTPDKTKMRQVSFFRGKADTAAINYSEIMKRAIDSPEGKVLYGRRFATVEPVFGNIRYNNGLDRFTLRGKKKVDTQWKLFCLVHNIEKLAHHGYLCPERYGQ